MPNLPIWNEETPSNSYPPEDVFRAGLKNHHISNTAYPIAHYKTIWQFRETDDHYASLLKDAFNVNKEMSLYVHIPFCERRCSFCEYTVLDEHTKEIEDEYHLALQKELAMYKNLLDPKTKTLIGFDIGGGTPAFIDSEKIKEIVNEVKESFTLDKDFEISIETTPKVAATDPEKIESLKSAGIDRISMGLQMVNVRLLKEYGRDINKIGYNHTAVSNIRNAGFKRFNIDLMYGFAKQTVEDFRHTVEYTIDLDPEFITLYRMRYKGTKISSEAEDIELNEIMKMYKMAQKLLNERGYLANPGKNVFSRVKGDPGTSRYLTERVKNSIPYLGLGLGAQTFTNNILAYNLGASTKKIDQYLLATKENHLPIQDLYHLPISEGIAKMVSVSFYFGQICLDAFIERFGIAFEDYFVEEVKFVLAEKLMEYKDGNLRLTQKGSENFNGVIALFYSNRVKEHLLSL